MNVLEHLKKKKFLKNYKIKIKQNKIGQNTAR